VDETGVWMGREQMSNGGQPKVSIIIPVYNGAKYLREAVDSALAQTYPRVEVIVVNDGSDDKGTTEKIALSYGGRIRYFAKEHGGVSSALNLGIAHMTGEYFSWLSHDDVYHPQKIERQIRYLQDNGTPDTILYGGYQLIDRASQINGHVKLNKLYPEEKLNIPLFPLMRGLINGCSLLIHKSHFERAGLFDEKLFIVQDYALWFKMFRQARVRFLPGLYVKTRIHREQQSRREERRFAEESDAMWISFLDTLTHQEMCEMDGSPYMFYHNTVIFLKKYSPCGKARLYAQELAERMHGKISVIIPFHNRIPVLLEAVKSVLAQSYQNIEVWLVDDGSTDNIEALKKIEDPRFHYVYQEHKGVSAARNLGISLSSGKYVAFLDSDDLFMRDKLAKQIDFMEKNNYFFSHTSYQRINMEGKLQKVVNSGRLSGQVFPGILASCGIATSTVMVRREILQDKKFNEAFQLGEDVCLWIDLAYQYTLGGAGRTADQSTGGTRYVGL
jgi:glycosyltransferase involved in cell wall biosynthesis